MLGKLMAIFAAIAVAFFAATGFAFAAVDVNSADQAQLESIKGIGPAIATKIVAERKKGNFKDWADLETRVSGVGDKNSAKFSEGGLTVGGKAKADAPAMAQSTTKSTKKSETMPATATPSADAKVTAAKSKVETPAMSKSATTATKSDPLSEPKTDTRSAKTTILTRDGKQAETATTETKTKSKSKKTDGDTAATTETKTTTKK